MCRRPAFSLVEMMAVIGALSVLISVGAGLLRGTAAQARRAGTDELMSLLDQASTAAVSSRSHVMLAVTQPAGMLDNGPHCRFGLFRLERWPDSAGEVVPASQLGRWRELPTGVTLAGGQVAGGDNALDSPPLVVALGGSNNLSLEVHAIVFNPQGRLQYPSGSRPVVLRLVEGEPGLHRGAGLPAQSLLKIGRVNSRVYQADE